LELKDVSSGYGQLQILWDVSINVAEGEFVAILGPNGAGKTTVLRTISGLIRPMRGEVRFLGERIDRVPAERLPRMGLSFVPEDNRLFEGMTVLENLLLGAHTVPEPRKVKETLSMVMDLFPWLKERRSQLAGTLSGGERKMLAIARGLMSSPKLLLIDEPSLGLGPRVVVSVFEVLKKLSGQGVTILLVEQNVGTTLQVTNRAYVLEQGRVILEGKSSSLLDDEYIKKAYLGTV
jgi:branched-chain amino acid transport system ATP-binding protein